MNDDLYSPIEPKKQIPIGQIATGAILLVVGVGWLLTALDIATIPWRALLAGALIVIGIALIAAASQGVTHDGLVSVGTTLVIVLAVLSTLSSVFSIPLRGGVGDRSYEPTMATLQDEYRLIAGQLIIDLSDVVFAAGDTTLESSVTFGKLVIEGIPDDVTVTAVGKATAGEIIMFGTRWDGVGLDERITDGGSGGEKRLLIEASVGFGQIEVDR
jgi:hypothetical protein